jgi:RNA polymerase sigma-70 factor (ECF subfamily)
MTIDDGAFEVLFRAHYAALCGFALHYVESPAVAEELVQDLFAHLWVHRATLPAPRNARAYLFTAVRNRALNARKRQQLEADWEQEAAIDAQESAGDPVPDAPDAPDAADAADAPDAAELQRRVDGAIASLPERCRLVVHLRWREQMSHVRIAEIMGISVKGVEIQLTRGLARLRELLGTTR